jgi:hypothetical protein
MYCVVSSFVKLCCVVFCRVVVALCCVVLSSIVLSCRVALSCLGLVLFLALAVSCLFFCLVMSGLVLPSLMLNG